MPVHFTPNQAGITKMLGTTTGSLALWMGKVVIATKGSAHQNLRNNMVDIQTGKLIGSLKTRVYLLGGKPVGEVSANTRYAKVVHQGQRRHVIRPRRPGGVLKFKVGSATVYAMKVNHPGAKKRPYLRQALQEVVLLYARKGRASSR